MILSSLLTLVLASFTGSTSAIVFDSEHNYTSITGTWSSGSKNVMTGPVSLFLKKLGSTLFCLTSMLQGFANPLNQTFTYPSTTGIAYSLCVSSLSLDSIEADVTWLFSTDDGFYEISRYRFTGNGAWHFNLLHLLVFSCLILFTTRLTTSMYYRRVGLGAWNLQFALEWIHNNDTFWRRISTSSRSMRSRFQLYPIVQRHRALPTVENFPWSTNGASSQFIPIWRLTSCAYVPNIDNADHASHAIATEYNCYYIRTFKTIIVKCWRSFETRMGTRSRDCCGSGSDSNSINGAIDNVDHHNMYVFFVGPVLTELKLTAVHQTPTGIFVTFYHPAKPILLTLLHAHTRGHHWTFFFYLLPFLSSLAQHDLVPSELSVWEASFDAYVHTPLIVRRQRQVCTGSRRQPWLLLSFPPACPTFFYLHLAGVIGFWLEGLLKFTFTFVCLVIVKQVGRLALLFFGLYPYLSIPTLIEPLIGEIKHDFDDPVKGLHYNSRAHKPHVDFSVAFLLNPPFRFFLKQPADTHMDCDHKFRPAWRKYEI